MDIVEVYFTILTIQPMHLAMVFYVFCGIAGQFIADILFTFATILY